MPTGDKYIDLTNYLNSCGQDTITLTFDQVSSIVSGLPAGAYRIRQYWSNYYNVLSSSWLNADYYTHDVKMDHQIVVFSKGASSVSSGSREKTKNLELGRNQHIKDHTEIYDTVMDFFNEITEDPHGRYAYGSIATKLLKEPRTSQILNT